MTTEEIVLALFGVSVAVGGAVWAHWFSRRFDESKRHQDPAE